MWGLWVRSLNKKLKLKQNVVKIVSQIEIISEEMMSALSKMEPFKDNFFKISAKKAYAFF